ncbi:MAG: CpsD/CapB family tyrosine-protein kinase, partial [Chitinispirillaceae bacterium]|nr:CpsD/CapB family tyrosine-protein kinase [Chitinispirillaceae bacterium]
QMHTLFSIPKEGGLTDFLLGAKTVDDIMKKSVYEELSIITSGERPHNPAELVGTYQFDLLIKELRQRADIVIFDSPALLPVSDTLTMAPKMDAIVFILRTMWTPLKAAKQAVHQLNRIGCHILGGIFNGVSGSRAYYPYYYGYYGYYSYSKYTYDDEPHKKFSWRSFGLSAESTIKNTARSVRYSLPRHSAMLGRFMGHLARKKSFWLLFLLFLGLTGAELWHSLNPPEKTTAPEEESIRYLGIGAGYQETQPLPRPVDRSPMPEVRSPAESANAMPDKKEMDSSQRPGTPEPKKSIAAAAATAAAPHDRSGEKTTPAARPAE